MCTEDKQLSVIIEDNGVVAYAYLVYDNQIISDVWLYNRANTPENLDWSSKEEMPFLNPYTYTNNEKFIEDVNDISKVIIKWNTKDSKYSAYLCFMNGLKVLLKYNSCPGWSNNVKKNGPLAKGLTSSKV